MDLTEALTKATAAGWNDDSRYTPSTVAHQVSAVRDGFLASVTVAVSGTIKWNVAHLTGHARSRRGQAASMDAAMAACDNAVAAATGTLF